MTAPTEPYRRIAAAALLQAVTDAARGDVGASVWMAGDVAAQWADVLGLHRWPPAPSMLGTRRDLIDRAARLGMAVRERG